MATAARRLNRVDRLHRKLAPADPGVPGAGCGRRPGSVGLPLALRIAETGFPTVGLDTDERRARALSEGRPYVDDVPAERFAGRLARGANRPTIRLIWPTSTWR